MMKDQLESYILSGQYSEAKEIFENTEYQIFYDNLLDITFNNQNISNYTFVVYLLLEENHERLHDLAYILLSQPLCHMEGAYASSVFHARTAVKLNGFKEVRYMENILFLNTIPDCVVSDEEAKDISEKILSIDPNHEIALDILKG
ncbi:hypothetical protein BpOF4_21964 (plasmid) [Alkalihalophilus pseudofirmus OF4]|uniref:Immunity protein 30 domain-containing protein n=1 Tax=Alkalihalophilus pseudofirmus (strain ATCC BAA-2126 / JCM 17055 / OF4) TaxID=398511 RepID=D3G212_ALKPO|nr:MULTISPECIES: hypothetical protein [Alkalihalophilus]ADC52388.1 hypothetical protein BpOF4_21964 [Alkalihalophilus pseudofirmus OF4]MED1603435.1 hypothetical protein [Alkalihalophilus marmarensis]